MGNSIESSKICSHDFDEIRNIFQDLFNQYDIPYPASGSVPLDSSYFSDCCAYALSKGYTITRSSQIFRSIHVGSVMGQIAYGHLPDRASQIYMAMFTGVLVVIDTLAQFDVERVRPFYGCFINGHTQPDPELELVAQTLRDATKLYPPVQAAMIVNSALTFINGSVIETELRNLKLSSDAPEYPYFVRALTGIAEAYSIIVFPAAVPLEIYIQALPALGIWINATNDVLSFYKEELEGENNNYVSRVAHSRGISKINALRSIAEEAISADRRVHKILGADKQMGEIYAKFREGYTLFHVASSRYRLHDLSLWEHT
ncbi:terpenoid synthase [Coniophora puteana RWD-64-598 SS2]|uniref:Terpenoid synthase n=1 Tax=Coniophora puteana (strain RWD-64-598) TaxID=741705 RepID=R7SDP1_CONPW|nr:terpenoid synthase [Coniophora puteana RWD-64-598 SS2]EIW74283.1 terpenoid synthase [Coniophora puteana RWD-64-598 SS2]